MLGLLEEFTGYRAEAGVHYCCAMRLAYKTNLPETGDMLSRRLSQMASTSQDTIFHRPAASEDDTRRNTEVLAAAPCARFDVLLGSKMPGLKALVSALNHAPAEGGVLSWFVEDLPGLVSGLDSKQRKELQKVATQSRVIEALQAGPAKSS